MDASVCNKGEIYGKKTLNSVYLYAYQSNSYLGNKLYAIYLCAF